MRVGILNERIAEEYPQVKCSSTVCSSTSVVFVFPTCAPSPILQLPSPSVSSAEAAASCTASSFSRYSTVWGYVNQMR